MKDSSEDPDAEQDVEDVDASTERHAGRSEFVQNVFAIVLQIPYGKVTTYGRIARAVGAPRSARMVGWALHNCPEDVGEIAHRVINRNGELTGGWSFGHPSIMRGLLEDEGVTFIDEYQVDLPRHVWEPEYEDLDEL
ncbi:MAG TPA: MGMT family protein [Nitrolancea sp.]|nr:MGMT family protein [Nitrolancea sp.]